MNTTVDLEKFFDLEKEYSGGVALSKEQLYDMIGKLNKRIVENQQKIYDLEDALRSALNIDEPENEIAIHQSMRELRKEMEDATGEIKNIRKVIISRLELEVEEMERKVENGTCELAELERYRATHSEFVKELQTLRKLVA